MVTAGASIASARQAADAITAVAVTVPATKVTAVAADDPAKVMDRLPMVVANLTAVKADMPVGDMPVGDMPVVDMVVAVNTANQ